MGASARNGLIEKGGEEYIFTYCIRKGWSSNLYIKMWKITINRETCDLKNLTNT